MNEKLISAGIDIGTSTTQLIFSELVVANTGGFGSVPKIEVTDKKIIYRSQIHITPLLNEEYIDGDGVAKIIASEYKKSGMKQSEIQTGAVIITGETSQKRNAKKVLQALSEYSGDFVVAAAGPDLESVLSGKGAGASELSLEHNSLVANLDIGGGTTNISYFFQGEVVDTACLNIGGRLIKVDEKGTVLYVSDSLLPVLKDLNMELSAGDFLDETKAEQIANRMSEIIAESIGLLPSSMILAQCYTNHGITYNNIPNMITFSGGVADCISSDLMPFEYGDMGVYLGQAIKKQKAFEKVVICKGQETVNATVVGAGNYSMEVSGSTVFYNRFEFPVKSVSVYSVALCKEEDLLHFSDDLKKCNQRMKEGEIGNESKNYSVLSFQGIPCPTFLQIETMADAFVLAFEEEIEKDHFPILIMESDTSKVLGQALRRRIGGERKILCIDNVRCKEGDFVDIGNPIGGGKAIPVSVKTLIFGSRKKL